MEDFIKQIEGWNFQRSNIQYLIESEIGEIGDARNLLGWCYLIICDKWPWFEEKYPMATTPWHIFIWSLELATNRRAFLTLKDLKDIEVAKKAALAS